MYAHLLGFFKFNQIFNRINLPTKGDLNSQKVVFLGSLGVSFGNLTATAKNVPPGTEEPKSPEGAQILVKAASNCCSMNNECSIVFSQLCTALACFECVNCSYELCACVYRYY